MEEVFVFAAWAVFVMGSGLLFFLYGVLAFAILPFWFIIWMVFIVGYVGNLIPGERNERQG